MNASPWFLHTLSILFSLTVNAIGDDTRLVSIFCSEVVSSGLTVSLETGWKELVSRLEKRESSHPSLLGNKIQQKGYEECVQQYGLEFETGEFILQGREYFHSLVKQAKLSQLEPQVSIRIETKGVEGFSTSAILDETHNPLFSDSDIKSREQQYDLLWKNFIKRIKNL